MFIVYSGSQLSGVHLTPADRRPSQIRISVPHPSEYRYNGVSPRMVFKTEDALWDAICRVARGNPQIALSDMAGLIQFSFNSELSALAKEIIEKYYQV